MSTSATIIEPETQMLHRQALYASSLQLLNIAYIQQDLSETTLTIVQDHCHLPTVPVENKKAVLSQR